MSYDCALCPRRIKDRAFSSMHWLCRSHRRASARLAFPRHTIVSETDLLQSLVFTFPTHCGLDEFTKRLGYASEIWCTHDKVEAVTSAHGLTHVTITRGLQRDDVLEMVERLVAFMCRIIQAHPCLHAHISILDQRVRGWYPQFVQSGSRSQMIRTERMVHHLHGVTGQWAFLVLSVLAVTIGRILPADMVERIYASYLEMFARPSPTLAGFLPHHGVGVAAG